MSYSQKYKNKAVNLRGKGFSYTEISKVLGVRKSTVYEWAKHIVLNNTAKARIENIKITARKKGNDTKHLKKMKAIDECNKLAKKTLSSIHLTPKLAQICCSLLYWCEGGKFTDNRLEFTNSDPDMIKTYLKLLRMGFKIDEQKLRANVHIHEYHNEQKLKLFWHNITNIPLEKFNKSYLKPHTKKVIRENYQGCVRISYYSDIVAKKIKALYQEFSRI